MFKPVFTITETILKNLTTIASSEVTVENAPLIPKWEVSIRREALLRNAHASTAIEGNPLTLDQVSQLAAGRNIMVQRKAKAGAPTTSENDTWLSFRLSLGCR